MFKKNNKKKKKDKKKKEKDSGERYQQPESVFSEIRCNSTAPHILKESLLSLWPVYGASIWTRLLWRGYFPAKHGHVQREKQFIKTTWRLGFSRGGRDLIARREGGKMDEHRLLLRNSANRWSNSQSNKPHRESLIFPSRTGNPFFLGSLWPGKSLIIQRSVKSERVRIPFR